MDYMFPLTNNGTLLVSSDKLASYENFNSSQEEEPPLFLQFPSPIHDHIDTTTILHNLHHQDHLSTNGCRTTNIISRNNPSTPIITTTEPLPSKVKGSRRRRAAGKKDRHSKIHTARGLRDRRMRLSVHTARKFFDLNDMLGFDKASKTIEWLFLKSKKAIEEVTESRLQSNDATLTENIDSESPLSACEAEPVIEMKDVAEKDASLELQYDSMADESSQKRTNMNKRNDQLFEVIPAADSDQPQLGFWGNLDNWNMEESLYSHRDYSNIYNYVKHLHLDNTVNVTTISSTYCSIFDCQKSISEPLADSLSSRNTFFGFLGSWDSENPRMETNQIMPNMAPLTDGVNGESPSSGIISTSDLHYFHPQNHGQR